MLFNLHIMHSYMPVQCKETVIVPIIKIVNGDISNSGNYKPIAIASVISKLFEHFILSRIKPLLSACDDQFGFTQYGYVYFDYKTNCLSLFI